MTAWYSVDNWLDVDGVTITPSAEVATMTAENLRKRQVGRRWRVDSLTTGSTDFYVDIDLGSARSIGVLGFMTPRDNDQHSDLGLPLFGATDTIQWELSNVQAGDAELYDSTAIASGVLPGYGYHVHIVSPAVSARYIRASFDAVTRDTAPDNFADIGRLWIGSRTDFLIGYAAPMNFAWTSNSVATRSLKSVAEYVDRRDPYRVINAVFRGVKESERIAMVDFERKTTNAAQFLFGLNQTTPARDAMLCRNEARGLEQFNRAYYRREFTLIESL